MPEITRKMGQSPSSVRSKSSRKSFRSFVRRTKLNTSSLSHTFSLPPSEEYPELMNINTATEEQLMTLPGVNRQLAREIVRHRQMIGRYKRVDDLALVSGIGAEKLESLRPEICTGLRRQVSRASSCTHSLDSFRLSIESKLCSVNSSSVFQLQCVPGLNQEIAANIVDYRNKKGPFKSLDDLIKVRGIDIIRLSTVKPHLSLDLRKCGSELHLTNGHLNGWTDSSLNDSILSSELKTPNTPHRKSFSAPSKFSLTLPNGFATAPVNDILDLLSAYSHRPIVEENFMYERDGVKCCRLATWNLHQLSIEKVTNPGVREVVCRTILENNEALGFIFENSNRSVTIEDVALDQLHLVVEAAEVKRLVAALLLLRGRRFRTCAQAFLICGRPIVVVNVQIFETLDEGDSKRFEEVVEIAASAKLQLVFLGDI
ncbi:unnamed protein product [Leptidea sinapis]|uniref:Endonuclease/exonuclease/phosphatase family domain-containing protein 1 n=1 Tax=Leptidea sinapis TaxID=189913 RepID=A0A5E4Q4K2_9NEOP|nr:unnamed protein product [Leptidea sinapis]